jgi:hypothetical protein
MSEESGLTSDAPVFPARCRDWRRGFPGASELGAYDMNAAFMQLQDMNEASML